MANNHNEGSVSLRIIRGPLDSLSLYEITDYELGVLEEGTPSSTFLNFAILFFSVGVSFFITLATVELPIDATYVVFVILTVVGLGASVVLFVLWFRTRSKVKDLIKKIKARVPTVPVADAAEATAASSGITENG